MNHHPAIFQQRSELRASEPLYRAIDQLTVANLALYRLRRTASGDGIRVLNDLEQALKDLEWQLLTMRMDAFEQGSRAVSLISLDEHRVES